MQFSNVNLFLFPQYKLCRVKKVGTGPKGIPFIVTHDGRTIRYPDPQIKAHDSVRYDISSGKIVDFIKFQTGNLCMVTGGHNLGRVGVITSRERHVGSFDIIHIKDSLGHTFATRYVLLHTNAQIFSLLMNFFFQQNRSAYIFVIGKGNMPYVSLPRGRGLRLTVAEERDKRLAKKTAN